MEKELQKSHAVWLEDTNRERAPDPRSSDQPYETETEMRSIIQENGASTSSLDLHGMEPPNEQMKEKEMLQIMHDGLKKTQINGQGAYALHQIGLGIDGVLSSPLTCREFLAHPKGEVLSTPGATDVLQGAGFIWQQGDQWRFDGNLKRLQEARKAIQASIVTCDEQMLLAERRALMATQDLEYEAALMMDRERSPPIPTEEVEEGPSYQERRATVTKEPGVDEKIVEISIKLSNVDGTLRRRFLVDAAAKEIYDWLYSHSSMQGMDNAERLEIVCSYPRVDVEDSEKSLAEHGMEGRTMLVAHMISLHDGDSEDGSDE